MERKQEYLKIGDKVYGGYKISSLPYHDKSEAYNAISEDWQGVDDVTTYYFKDNWYIITK